MVETLAAFLPFVIIAIVGLYYLRYANKQYKQHVDEVNAVNQKIVDTNQEMIGLLAEIRDELKGRGKSGD